MKTLRRLLLFVLVLGVLGVGTLAGTSWYYGGDDGMGGTPGTDATDLLAAFGIDHCTIEIEGPGEASESDHPGPICERIDE